MTTLFHTSLLSLAGDVDEEEFEEEFGSDAEINKDGLEEFESSNDK